MARSLKVGRLYIGGGPWRCNPDRDLTQGKQTLSRRGHGYHRICASWHVDENAMIPCRIVAPG